MFEKYKSTGKHRKNDESLVTVDDIQRRLEQEQDSHLALKELISNTDSDPVQNIKTIDVAIKQFGTDMLSEQEKTDLSDIIIESAEQVADKETTDFIDPFILGTSVDILRELKGDSPDTEPILTDIKDTVEKMSDPAKNIDKTIKLSPDEVTAILTSIRDFKDLPSGHTEDLMYLIDHQLRRVSDTHIAYSDLRAEDPKHAGTIKEVRRSVDDHYDELLQRRHLKMGIVARRASQSTATTTSESQKAA